MDERRPDSLHARTRAAKKTEPFRSQAKKEIAETSDRLPGWTVFADAGWKVAIKFAFKRCFVANSRTPVHSVAL